MTRLDGADISHYQYDYAPIDWPALRASTWWVACKATQGVSYVDPTFAKSWAQMGVGFTHRLAYHWLTPFTNATNQAFHFLRSVPSPFLGGVMLDAEEGGITAAQVLEWCEAVEATTRRPVAVYTGAYVAGGTIWQSTKIRTSKYGVRPMHLAAYTTEAKALALPGVKAYPWSAWQYSSNGPVPGVTGRCDMNRVDNRAAYDLVCGVTATPTPIPGDDDMAVATFEVESLPGIYMWGPGMPAPIPFTDPANFTQLSTALGAGSAGKISHEMYLRLFTPPTPVNVTVPPIAFPSHFTGTIS